MTNANTDLQLNASKVTFLDGITAFFGGVWFILATPSVWGYACVPIGLVLIMSCGIGIAGFWSASAIVNSMLGESNDIWWRTGSWFVTYGITVAIFTLGIFLAILLAQPLSSFALEAIVSAQEKALGCRPLPSQPFIAATLSGLRIAVIVMVIGLTISLILLLINLAFPPAALITAPLEFFVAAWLLSWDFLDYPLGMRGLGFFARLKWARGRFGAFTAFGLAWAVVLLIPGVFLFLLPMGVAGAARLVTADERKGQT